MKVKGIMFSGFAAAILMGTVDASAYTIASKAYVDQEIETLGSSITGNGGVNSKITTLEDSVGDLQDALGAGFDEDNTVAGAISGINTALSGKQATLTGAAADAVASGITTAKVSSYDGHIANDDIHVTAADKTKWNGYEATIATKAAASDLSTLSGTVSALGTKVGSGNLPATINNQAVSDIVGAITQLDAKLTSVATTTASSDGMQQLSDDIDALESLVGDTSVSSQISGAITALDLANTYEAKGAAAQLAAGQVATNTTAIATINNGAVMNSGITSAKVTQIETNTGDIATNAANIGTLNTRTALLADKTTCTGPSDKCVLTIDKNTGSLAWVNIVGAGNNLSDLTDDVE